MTSLRADRLATIYLVRPWRQLIARRNSKRIPILMYHSISELSATNAHPYFETRTSPGVFEMQMKYLYENGYSTISPADVVAILNSGRSSTTKEIVITFDDGFRDFYLQAFPILEKYGLNATVYLPTGYINRDLEKFLGKQCMTWSEIRELNKLGVGFGSHTVNHPSLKLLSEPDLEREIRCSKDAIESELGSSINSFAYPHAFPEQDRTFLHRLRDALRGAGYQNGVSTIIGSVQSLEEKFFMKRLPVNSWDDLRFFQAKIHGDYDWLHSPQYLKKLLVGSASEFPSAGRAASHSRNYDTGH
jgi:peptidoglycan/xylan/chitin deacetylase (PgdA/CDA1 family)